jgi:hypothetical protein
MDAGRRSLFQAFVFAVSTFGSLTPDGLIRFQVSEQTVYVARGETGIFPGRASAFVVLFEYPVSLPNSSRARVAHNSGVKVGNFIFCGGLRIRPSTTIKSKRSLAILHSNRNKTSARASKTRSTIELVPYANECIWFKESS